MTDKGKLAAGRGSYREAEDSRLVKQPRVCREKGLKRKRAGQWPPLNSVQGLFKAAMHNIVSGCMTTQNLPLIIKLFSEVVGNTVYRMRGMHMIMRRLKKE